MRVKYAVVFELLYITVRRHYGGGPGGMTGWSLRYQGELLGLWDPQNRDLRRKPPPETIFWLADYHPLWVGVLISGHNMYTYHIYTYRGG